MWDAPVGNVYELFWINAVFDESIAHKRKLFWMVSQKNIVLFERPVLEIVNIMRFWTIICPNAVHKKPVNLWHG